jgi:hypothetical protein
MRVPADQREPPVEDAEGPEVAYLQPEQVKSLSGMQTVEDKVDNLCQRIEARDNSEDDALGPLTYIAIILAFFVGSLLSGPVDSATGGGTDQPVGLVDLTPMLEVIVHVV